MDAVLATSSRRRRGQRLAIVGAAALIVSGSLAALDAWNGFFIAFAIIASVLLIVGLVAASTRESALVALPTFVAGVLALLPGPSISEWAMAPVLWIGIATSIAVGVHVGVWRRSGPLGLVGATILGLAAVWVAAAAVAGMLLVWVVVLGGPHFAAGPVSSMSPPSPEPTTAAAACAGATFFECERGVESAIAAGATRIVLCDFGQGMGSVERLDPTADPAAVCSANGLLPLSRVVKIVELPSAP
jgi:hypothetical protein